MEYILNCPCCNNKIKVQIGDDGEITIVSFIENINKDEIQKKLIEHGIEFGIQKGR